MPANTTPTAFTVETTRTCAYPGHEGDRELAFTSENFYIRPNGTADYWCRGCVRRYNRERRQSGAVRRTRTRKFGVEIEFIGGAAEVVREMTRRGLQVQQLSYTHRVMRSWKIVPDASVMRGYELVSPPLSGAAGREQIRKACESLQAAGATVNRSCGLHVHHEITDLNGATVKRLANGWSRSQRAIDMLVSPSRRNNTYAHPLQSRDLESIGRIPDDATSDGIRNFLHSLDRFRTLNLAGFPRYGTVEIRQHQGTTSADKIIGWLDFGQAMIERAKNADAAQSFDRADALLAQLADFGLDARQVTYLNQRADRFMGARV
jgi:hypothetical protein